MLKDNKIRVMIADSSAFIRVSLSTLLNKDSTINVCTTTKTGSETIEKIKKFNPDVILIDINLAEIDGITLTKKIINEKKIPIIITSSSQSEDQTLVALNSGAVDFISIKRDQNNNLNEETLNELITKIKTVANANISVTEKNIEEFKFSFKKRIGRRIIAIGSSTGGPQTLEQVLPLLPKEIPCPVLVVQHMPPVFTKSLAERLNSFSEITIKEAEQGEEVKNGVAYMAPGDYHMTLVEDGPRIRINLDQRPKELGVRPCANYLFDSVARIYKENTIGIVLTGMGSDGTVGCKTIKELRGTVIVESEKSSIIFGMPKSVIEAGYYDEVLDLEKIPVAIIQLLEV